MILVVLALLGYFYTAFELELRLFHTVLLVLGILLAYHLVLRGLRIEQRRIALARAREKRAALRASREATEPAGADGGGEGEDLPVELPELDLSTISDQTRHLLRTLVFLTLVVGTWAVWADVLPALNFLQKVELWSHEVLSSEGTPELVPITLADLALSLLVTLLTTVAARNIPGVLEIVLLQRLPLEPGSRYAITTVGRYLITGLGFIAAVGILGMSWSSLQWLVAALGVGLGFGLQEIFANFVSGLIILFERPIRVGDTVTVGGINGTVSRIRIRATTITDWDRKELIVPNKSFITENLVNWTLSDPITRIIIPVGIAYGSDTELAYRTLLEAAEAEPLVLDDPAPRAHFLEFGESSLNFELRIFVRGINALLNARHAVHMAVDRAFRELDIEISFPQRDLHLRSVVAPFRMDQEGKTAGIVDPPAGDAP